jgi:hypothetical protein
MKYFVIGGTYKNLKGEERFELVCQGPGEQPYVLIESVMAYFKLIYKNAHLYRVEDDYSLTLVVPSPEALRWGVKALKGLHLMLPYRNNYKKSFATIVTNFPVVAGL